MLLENIDKTSSWATEFKRHTDILPEFVLELRDLGVVAWNRNELVFGFVIHEQEFQFPVDGVASRMCDRAPLHTGCLTDACLTDQEVVRCPNLTSQVEAKELDEMIGDPTRYPEGSRAKKDIEKYKERQ